ncbi:MAG TPA: carboxypeptidase-like regulatory domain-containing protein [Methylomirabilota bacterium]|jgi:hypothetical protein|nr:carboxypeptidase-like regulatory domain-containing protein [Methylomirabilota bacterium]
MRARLAISALLVGLGLLVAVLVGCGGHSSSSTAASAGGGGGGSAAVQGQIRTRTAARTGTFRLAAAARTLLGIRLAEAAPIAGVTVELVNPLDPTDVLYSAPTSAGGTFLITGVAPGTYQILVPGYTLTPDPTLLEVFEGDKGIVDGIVDGDTITLTATVTITDIEDFLQNTAQLCHAVSIAQATGTSLQQIIAERLAGNGWGQIARNHGAHPSILGNRNCTGEQVANASALARGAAGKGKGKGKS